MLSQLVKHLQEILAIPTCNLYAFTDSIIVLYWIYGRVSVSRPSKQTELEKFKKMFPLRPMSSAKKNPADFGSRGIPPGEIINHNLWWNGPSWLKEDSLQTGIPRFLPLLHWRRPFTPEALMKEACSSKNERKSYFKQPLHLI